MTPKFDVFKNFKPCGARVIIYQFQKNFAGIIFSYKWTILGGETFWFLKFIFKDHPTIHVIHNSSIQSNANFYEYPWIFRGQFAKLLFKKYTTALWHQLILYSIHWPHWTPWWDIISVKLRVVLINMGKNKISNSKSLTP